MLNAHWDDAFDIQVVRVWLYSQLSIVSVLFAGYVVFSYVGVWGDTSNMIFVLNFCFATRYARSTVAAWKFLGQLEIRQQNCPVRSLCSVCGVFWWWCIIR